MDRKTTLPLTALGLLFTVSSATAQDIINMRTATSVAETTSISECYFTGIPREIERLSEGRIEVEVSYGGSPLSDQARQYDFVASGILDFAHVALSMTPGRFPLTSMIGFPLLVEDRYVGTRVLTRLLEEELQEEFDDVKVLALTTPMPVEFHSRREMTGMDDLAGQRMRVHGEEAVAAAGILGVDPVSVGLQSVYENLQRGVIDGGLLTFTAVSAFRFDEVTSSHIVSNFQFGPIAYVMNRNTYENLPDDLKKLFDDLSGLELALRIAECFEEGDKEGMERVEARGNNIIYVDESERAAYREQMMPAYMSIVDRLESEGYPARHVFSRMMEEMGIED